MVKKILNLIIRTTQHSVHSSWCISCEFYSLWRLIRDGLACGCHVISPGLFDGDCCGFDEAMSTCWWIFGTVMVCDREVAGYQNSTLQEGLEKFFLKISSRLIRYLLIVFFKSVRMISEIEVEINSLFLLGGRIDYLLK